MTDRDTSVPNPLISEQEYARFYHLDIPELENVELTDELHYFRSLLWGLPTEHWLRERVSQLEAELQKRKFDVRNWTSKRRKPKPAEGVKL
ncbi:hypothetical protein ACFLUJ_02045 [Chloroflexota bacterium]